MAIDYEWTVNLDYTQTYTVTVDELNQVYDSRRLEQVQSIEKDRMNQEFI